MDRVIVIAGPTAVGKTEYALRLSEALGAEIVSADSMQIYKYMDIGSAKPAKEELARVPHHLIGEIDPRESFSAARYRELAKKAVFDILSRGRSAVVSGGTGLYISSLIYDMDFSAAPGDPVFRKRLEALAEKEGKSAVHELLRERSERLAARIHPNNLKRVIRALEVLENEGLEINDFEESFVPTKDYSYKLIGLRRERDELYGRIEKRVDMMMAEGLLDEVRRLLSMGLGAEDISMKGIGYKELIGMLNGEYELEHAVELIKKNTRHYAKRQLTWLKRYKELSWVDLSGKSPDAAEREILALTQS